MKFSMDLHPDSRMEICLTQGWFGPMVVAVKKSLWPIYTGSTGLLVF